MAHRDTLPPATFLIRPRVRGRICFIVHIADSLTAMRATMRRCSGWAHRQQLAAVDSATDWVRDRDGRRRKGCLCGVLYFARNCLGAGLVSHELSHAAFRYCERIGLRVVHWKRREQMFTSARLANRSLTASSEEKYCDVTEQLNRDFWNKAYRLGLTRRKAH